MMQGLRNAGQSWIGRIVVGILFGLLILSFGFWGIGDVFRGNQRSTVATVGDREVTAEAVRTAYQTELQTLSRRLRRNVPPGALAVSGGPQRNLAGWVQSKRSGTSQAEAAESAQASDRGPGRAGGDQGGGD